MCVHQHSIPRNLPTALKAYTSILASCSLFKPSWVEVATEQIRFVLFITWVTYVYRDIWPLATCCSDPADIDEGLLFGVKFAALTLAAVGVPLALPRFDMLCYLKVGADQISIGSNHSYSQHHTGSARSDADFKA